MNGGRFEPRESAEESDYSRETAPEEVEPYAVGAEHCCACADEDRALRAADLAMRVLESERDVFGTSAAEKLRAACLERVRSVVAVPGSHGIASGKGEREGRRGRGIEPLPVEER